MSARVVGCVDSEDLVRWRYMAATLRAIESKPEGFSVQEIRDAWIRKFTMCGEFVEKYGIDDTEDWNVSTFTGQIHVEG